MSLHPGLALRVVCAFVLAAMVVGIQPAAAQVTTNPLANDAQRLSDQPFATRSTFEAVFGGNAAPRWIAEHNAALAIGAPQRVRRIGYLYDGLLAQSMGPSSTDLPPAFIQGLREHGWEPGRDFTVEWRFTEGKQELRQSLANEVVGLGPDVIVAASGFAQQVKAATNTIPVAGNLGADPVSAGYVASLDRPGGNLTGVTTADTGLNGERLVRLKLAMPTAARVALLYNPSTPGVSTPVAETGATADQLGVQLQLVEARTADDLAGAFDAAARSDALIVISDGLFTVNRGRLVELANQHKLPVMHQGRAVVEEGGLMTYTTAASGSRSLLIADYVDKILRGAQPSDLPVRAIAGREFVLNLKAAQAIGFTFPEAALQQATTILQ